MLSRNKRYKYHLDALTKIFFAKIAICEKYENGHFLHVIVAGENKK